MSLAHRSTTPFMVLVVALASLIVVDDVKSAEPRGERIDFARDIQPILTARCHACHSEDNQEGQLRLDARAVALPGGVSGKLLTPDNAAASLLYQRIAGVGEGDRMPLDEDPLTAEEIDRIRRWIDQGAAWPVGVGTVVEAPRKHWAYEVPQRPQLPPAVDSAWVRSPIDAFILQRLRQVDWQPSPAAERGQLLRRVYFDLVGIPPTVAELDAFLADRAPDAYERVVNRLLASPEYGARWARPWLDAARYADSNGYQADQYRNVWPYRDWVIDSMNADMPFSQFTIEQIAGDLIPQASVSQKVATGFHRLTTCNVEAGVDPEENRVNQIIDRVNTTGTVWLGTTLECAQCHSHKYDPFSQRDYYQLFAFFNNTPMEVEGDGITFNFTGPKMELPVAPWQQAERDRQTAEYERLQGRLVQLVKQHLNDKTPELPETIAPIAAIPTGERDPQQTQKLIDHLAEHDPEIKQLEKKRRDQKSKLDGLQPATTLVMVEQGERRETAVFRRGNFLDRGEQVAMLTPRILPALDGSRSNDRRDLAAWLVSPRNPLTARVAVNRWWAEIFGQGIVTSLGDFGSQGERPTHPELLDWLAVELMESGWSRKHIHKSIVISSTYRQTSRVRSESVEQDPSNLFYARGPRFRLPAETVRDNALAISGLLSKQMDGPPVYPPQPAGVWRHVGRNPPKYSTSQGDERFRRGIYVFWRRSAPYPSFTNFDAPDRASCVVARPRTNTPLQALTLLNDPAYVEMSLALAKSLAELPEKMTVPERIADAFRRCTARQPNPGELSHLLWVYERERARYEQAPESADALVGSHVAPDDLDRLEIAAWFYVANILMNLDETITKG